MIISNLGVVQGIGILAAPTNLIEDLMTPLQIDLSWQDNAANETNYVIERKTDGGAWIILDATLPPNTTTYTDTDNIT